MNQSPMGRRRNYGVGRAVKEPRILATREVRNG